MFTVVSPGIRGCRNWRKSFDTLDEAIAEQHARIDGRCRGGGVDPAVDHMFIETSCGKELTGFYSGDKLDLDYYLVCSQEGDTRKWIARGWPPTRVSL